MAFDDPGVLFLSRARDGKVVALPDNNKDGKADRSVSILNGRQAPHGLAFVQLDSGYYLYVAEEDQVVRLKRTAKPFAYGKPEVLVSGIPTGGHFTRTIKIKNKKMFVSIGSSCNVCIEDSPLRAAIWQYDLDGKNGTLFAKGLRNSVGIEFSPYSGELWGVNNGRDWQGDDHPREELNIIKQGKHYGWPRCHENGLPDPDFGKGLGCRTQNSRPTPSPRTWRRSASSFTRRATFLRSITTACSSPFTDRGTAPSPPGTKSCASSSTARAKSSRTKTSSPAGSCPTAPNKAAPSTSNSPPPATSTSPTTLVGVVYKITGK